jgi:hypothetical protein
VICLCSHSAGMIGAPGHVPGENPSRPAPAPCGAVSARERA